MARALLTFFLLCVAAPSWAQDDPYLSTIEAAKAALEAKDWAGARTRLTEAEALAPQAGVLLPADAAAAIPFLRGAVEWGQGRQDAAFAWWRQALVMVPGMQPDRAILPENAAQDAFYALVGEVNQGAERSLGVPEDLPDGAIFVDGLKREAGETVLEGRHLVQVRCPEGGVKGAWHAFGQAPPDYFTLCQGGTYPLDKGGKKPRKEPPPKKEKPSRAEKAPAEKEKATSAPEATPSNDPRGSSAQKAAPSSTSAGRSPRRLAFDLTGSVLIGGALGTSVYAWSRWGEIQDASREWDEEGRRESARRTDVVPAYNSFYAALGVTGGLVLGGTTCWLLGGVPAVAPVAGGGMLSWSGSF